ncbi:MAG TPA: hypothetical protein VK655_08255, partial [Solirubrobacteraceae bacterium]|nr:hypothetical protein [Solirubrobacteraceae bacterium]
LRDAIVARRKHDTTPLGDAPQAGIANRPTAQHQPAPAPAALPIAPFAAPTPEPPPPNAPPPPPTAAQRPLTAAERLALKRRERR